MNRSLLAHGKSFGCKAAIHAACTTLRDANMVRKTENDPVEIGIALIEQQLLALLLYASAVADRIDHDKKLPDLATAYRLLRRKLSPTEPQTHVEDGTPGVERKALGLESSWDALHQDPQRLLGVMRVASTNAILAVAGFFEAHGFSELRTPEVQFLMRIRDAVANGNRFQIEDERIPTASFNGLIITNKLNGSPLFDDGVTTGSIDSGDVAALLRYLVDHLRGAQTLISAGDAG
jgi:hypothetical protein